MQNVENSTVLHLPRLQSHWESSSQMQLCSEAAGALMKGVKQEGKESAGGRGARHSAPLQLRGAGDLMDATERPKS